MHIREGTLLHIHLFISFAVPLLLPSLERAVETVVPSSQVETWCGARSRSSAAAQVRAYEQGNSVGHSIVHPLFIVLFICSRFHSGGLSGQWSPLQWWCGNAGSCVFKRATLVHAFVHSSIRCPVCLLFLSSFTHLFSLFVICTFVHSSFRRDMCRGPSPRRKGGGVTLPVGSRWQRRLAKRGLR